MLDSSDLRYLASECDRLECLIDGLSLNANASIEYVYHQHLGDETHNGGCYTKGYHKHLSSCPTKKVWKTETNSVDAHFHYSCGDHYMLPNCGEGCWICDRCGQHHSGWSGSGSWTHECSIQVEEYNCGSPHNRWKLNCGRREGEIEEALISFAPSGT